MKISYVGWIKNRRSQHKYTMIAYEGALVRRLFCIHSSATTLITPLASMANALDVKALKGHTFLLMSSMSPLKKGLITQKVGRKLHNMAIFHGLFP